MKRLLLISKTKEFSNKYISELAREFTIYQINKTKKLKPEVILILQKSIKSIPNIIKKVKPNKKSKVFISVNGKISDLDRNNYVKFLLRKYNFIYPNEYGAMIPEKIIDSILFATHRIRKDIKKDSTLKIDCWPNEFKNLANKISELGANFEKKGINYGDAGCISQRVKQGFIITSSGSKLPDITSKKLSYVYNKDGIPRWSGRHPPSSETPMHRVIYSSLNTNCIIHVHCPRITYSPKLDSIRTKKYVRYGCDTTGKAVLKILKRKKIAILRYHGIVAIGKNLSEASNNIFMLKESLK